GLEPFFAEPLHQSSPLEQSDIVGDEVDEVWVVGGYRHANRFKGKRSAGPSKSGIGVTKKSHQDHGKICDHGVGSILGHRANSFRIFTYHGDLGLGCSESNKVFAR